ncbi:Hypothetical predicted protein [Lecanosticta acicola]|uniref:Uncharacterized protein n=1 Tax=Lecanosticta acicola TaxID=111012 RepID=A0AAI8YYK5_9PEZI|nr:Hypothetical predicted protein [Lecanosticta acicola]
MAPGDNNKRPPSSISKKNDKSMSSTANSNTDNDQNDNNGLSNRGAVPPTVASQFTRAFEQNGGDNNTKPAASGSSPGPSAPEPASSQHGHRNGGDRSKIENNKKNKQPQHRHTEGQREEPSREDAEDLLGSPSPLSWRRKRESRLHSYIETRVKPLEETMKQLKDSQVTRDNLDEVFQNTIGASLLHEQKCFVETMTNDLISATVASDNAAAEVLQLRREVKEAKAEAEALRSRIEALERSHSQTEFSATSSQLSTRAAVLFALSQTFSLQAAASDNAAEADTHCARAEQMDIAHQSFLMLLDDLKGEENPNIPQLRPEEVIRMAQQRQRDRREEVARSEQRSRQQ